MNTARNLSLMLLPLAIGAFTGCMQPTSQDVQDQEEDSDSVAETSQPMAGAAWGAAVAIPGAYSRFSPVFSRWNNGLWMGYTGLDNRIMINNWNGSAWGNAFALPGITSRFAPVLGAWNNNLWALYHSGSGLYLNSWNGRAWGNPIGVPYAFNGIMPSLGVWNNRLNLFWPGAANALQWGAYDGRNWAGVRGLGIASPYSPAFGMWGGSPYLAYTGIDRGLYAAGWAGGRWGAGNLLWNGWGNWSPTLGVWGGNMNLFWGGGWNRGFGWGSWNGSAWNNLGYIPGTLGRLSPGLGFHGRRAYLGWSGLGNQLYWGNRDLDVDVDWD